VKLLSVLLSLLLGAAVLAAFLHPWDWDWVRSIEMTGTSTQRPAAPSPPPTVPMPAPVAQPPAAKPAEPVTGEIKTEEPHLLAREQAEAERQAALQDKAHAVQPAGGATKRYFKVKVRDAGSLEVDLPTQQTMLIRIEGIKAREADGLCTKADGTNWPCGAQARAALIRFIRARAVTCTLPPGGETADFTARCSVMGQDLSAWLVRQGWALPKQDSEPELAEAMTAARTDGIGLWENGAAPQGASP
jgi:endonuclease YncB( thermonuclease family)